MPEKLCRKCWSFKEVSEFYVKNDRLHSQCKDCDKIYNRDRYRNREDVREKRKSDYRELIAKDPDFRERNKKRGKAFYDSVSGRAKTLFRGAERRAKNNDEPFTLTLQHVEKCLDAGICRMTGIAFVFRATTPKGMHPFAPSLDRIDCTKPYSDDNSRIVIWAYNMMKGNMTDAQLLKICEAVVMLNAFRL